MEDRDNTIYSITTPAIVKECINEHLDKSKEKDSLVTPHTRNSIDL